MKFTLDKVGENQFVLLVPPHDRLLIDGKTGQVMVFTERDAFTARNQTIGVPNELRRIVNAINELETGNSSHVNRWHKFSDWWRSPWA